MRDENGRIGVFGGTFDPIHVGHLTAAEDVRSQLGLRQVLFVPAGEPWLKADIPVSLARHRLEMVRLAAAGNRDFKVCRLEVDRPGPSYTVNTIEELRRQWGAETQIFLLLGSDTLADLPLWKEPARLITLCRLAVFSRPGWPLSSLEWVEKDVPGISARAVAVAVRPVDVSATEIRRRVAQGTPISGLVPPAVERYIKAQGLYGGQARRDAT